MVQDRRCSQPDSGGCEVREGGREGGREGEGGGGGVGGRVSCFFYIFEGVACGSLS